MSQTKRKKQRLQREIQRRTKMRYYRKNPMQWMVDKLGFDPESIKWSLYDEYKNHDWDDKDPNLVTPDPLYQVLTGLANGQDVGVEAGTGTGKAQSIDTPILTPSGWIRMGDIEVGDEVIGSDGSATEVTGVYPQGVRDQYKVTFDDGSSTNCDPEHLWTVMSKNDRYRDLTQTKTTTQLKYEVEQEGRDWWIPMVDPVEHPEKNFPLDPYLLGVLVGDGGLTQNTPVLSTDDEFILEKVSERLPEGVVSKHRSNYDYGIIREGGRDNGSRKNANPVTKALRDVGLMGLKSENKFVPDEYLTGSIEQRVDLLHGLMDTDAWCQQDGTSFIYSTTSPQLVEGITDLVNSLGGTVGVATRDGGEDAKKSWRVSVRLPNHINPFSLPRKADKVKERSYGKPKRKIVSIEHVGQADAQCIKVDAEDSLYVTENYIVTHNTYLSAAICLWFVDCWPKITDPDTGEVLDPGGLVITVATKEKQLRQVIWKEIGNFKPMFNKLHPDAEWMDLKLRMDASAESSKEGWGISGLTASVQADEDVSTAFSGIHAPHMLFVIDEAPGVDEAILEAIENTCTGTHNLRLALGNPKSQNDALHSFCTQTEVKHVRASELDHPNVVLGDEVIPGAVTRRSVRRRMRKYNDPDHRIILSRVHGVSPSTSGSTLFPDAAIQKTKEHAHKGPIKHLRVRDPANGDLRIYIRPKSDMLNRYVIFADVAGDRSESGDWHAAVVLDRETREICAVLRMRGPRTSYVTELIQLCGIYTIEYGSTGHMTYDEETGEFTEEGQKYRPLLAYERDSVGGLHLDSRIKEYGNLYHQRKTDVQEEPHVRSSVGWSTNRSTRPDMIDALETWALELIQYPHRLTDKNLWNEARTFVFNDEKGKSGKWEADTGCHDDVIMATAGALTVDQVTDSQMTDVERFEKEHQQKERPIDRMLEKQKKKKGYDADLPAWGGGVRV